VLHFYRKLLRLRANSRTLIYGDFALIEREHPQVFAYTRSLENETYTIVCNMSGEPAVLSAEIEGDILFSNLPENRGMQLMPYEARVYRHVIV
jgi:glycosidase